MKITELGFIFMITIIVIFSKWAKFIFKNKKL